MADPEFYTLHDIDTNNKRVFLRVDINVPLDPSTLQILDDTRIRAIGERPAHGLLLKSIGPRKIKRKRN